MTDRDKIRAALEAHGCATWDGDLHTDDILDALDGWRPPAEPLNATVAPLADWPTGYSAWAQALKPDPFWPQGRYTVDWDGVQVKLVEAGPPAEPAPDIEARVREALEQAYCRGYEQGDLAQGLDEVGATADLIRPVLADLGREAALREEVERLRYRVTDYEDGHRAVMAEECAPDERHCTCVPHLREEIARLEWAEAEAMALVLSHEAVIERLTPSDPPEPIPSADAPGDTPASPDDWTLEQMRDPAVILASFGLAADELEALAARVEALEKRTNWAPRLIDAQQVANLAARVEALADELGSAERVARKCRKKNAERIEALEQAHAGHRHGWGFEDGDGRREGMTSTPVDPATDDR